MLSLSSTFHRFVTLSCILALLTSTWGNVVFAITHASYRGPTIGGRTSIAIVPGGASGTLVNTFTGNLILPRTDLRIPGRGLPIDLILTYNSNDDDIDGPFGFGWRFSYGIGYILQSDGDVVIIWGDGRTDLFRVSGNTYIPANESVSARLDQYQPNRFRVTTNEGIQYFLDDSVHRRVTTIRDPDGNALSFTYDNATLPYPEVTTITDASGRSVAFTYTNGKVTTITDPNTSPVRILRYDYDSNGNQQGFTDPLGNVTAYAYDSGHHMTQIADPLGTTNISYTPTSIAVRSVSRSSSTGMIVSARSFTYDDATLTTVVSDIVDETTTAVTSYTYGASHRLIRTTDGLGHSTTRTYDAAGNTASVTDANGNTTMFTYDARGNVLTITDPRGQTGTFTYEPVFNRVLSFTDPNEHTTTHSYDAQGHLTMVVDPLGNITRYVYDDVGQLLSRENARGFRTSFAYNAFGDRTSITNPLGDTRAVRYDNVGNVLSVADPNNNTTSYFYDLRNRRTRIVYPDSTEAAFTYNPAGKIVSALSPGTNLLFVYDANNRLLQSTNNILSKEISYQYDGVGNRVRMTGPEGDVTTYHYDTANRLVRIVGKGEAFLFDYDAGNRLTKRTFPNGAFTQYEFDVADNMLEVINRRADAGVISRFDYGYDNAGNRTELILASGDLVTYGYDARNQLIQEMRTGGTSNFVRRYVYDPVGNRTQLDADGAVTLYTYNSADQLIQDGTTTYEYDRNGNQVRKTVAGETFAYGYDFQDRLVAFSSPRTTALYAYDLLDRRVAKSVGGRTTRFEYDGLDAVAEYSEGGVLEGQYLFEPGVDQNLAKYAEGSSFYYLRDGLNSVTGIIDAAQTVRNSYDYDAWGNIVAQAEEVANDYTFTARQVDDESGLYYYRARMYDASIGRFIRLDPLEDNSGRSAYIYVDNDPVNNLDALGAGFWGAIAAAAAVVAAIAVVVTGVAAVVAVAAAVVALSTTGPTLAVAASIAVGAAAVSRVAQVTSKTTAKVAVVAKGLDIAPRVLSGTYDTASNTDHRGDETRSGYREGAAKDASGKADLNGDESVDIQDITAMWTGRNQRASGADDPGNLDGDGRRNTVNDTVLAVRLCDRPHCASVAGG